MIDRRTFLGSAGAGLLSLANPPVASSVSRGAETTAQRRLKLAVVTTEWRYHSHAWHMAERTLLTTGLVEAGVRSLGTGQQRLDTPHLAIRYQAPRESAFLRN